MRIRPRRSRLLMLWWLGLHGLAAAGVGTASLGPAATLLILIGLVGHAIWRFPRLMPFLVHRSEGDWAVPGLCRAGLRLGADTRAGGWWIRLELTDGGCRLRWLLLRDQLDPEVWRALQREVRVRGRIR